MINATIEARLGSSRFPNKVLKKINHRSFLEFQINRVKKSKLISNIIVATTNQNKDHKIINLCKKNKVKYFKGSVNNVLKRITLAHVENESKIVVRLCGDNPFQDPNMIDDTIKEYLKGKHDIVCYGGNPKIRKIPYGLDVEVLSLKLLKDTLRKTNKKLYLEHPAKYLYDVRKNLKIKFLKPKNKILYAPKLSFSLDYPDQYKFLKKVYNLSKNENITYKDLLLKIRKNKKVLKLANILSDKYILNRKF
tara:strand:+ start:1099 stop:1848 length:750 start_codon:yes stop_codon:yes gene_type:complete